MFFKGLILSCLLVSIQPQLYPQQTQYSPDNIYFREPPGVVPLTDNRIKRPSQDVLNQIFGPPQKPNVEVEKSSELLATTTVDREPIRQQSQVPFNNPPQNAPNIQTAQAIPVRADIPSIPNKSGYNGLLYSVTNFGINLLKVINAMQPGNTVVSPYSITSVLALLQQGTVGQTQDQVTAALQMTPDISSAAYTEISADYKSRNSPNILRTANNVFVGDTFSLNPDFKNKAQRNFDSDITPISFGQPEQATRQINNWVSKKTNNKIERLISPDAIDASTQLVLVNAIYFKGVWETAFTAEATRNREFHFGNGQTKSTPFMRMKKRVIAGIDRVTKAKVIVLPFERKQYSMMVILPSQTDNVRSALATLSADRLLSYLAFGIVDTEIELPKFTVRADTNLAPVMNAMGISKMFGPYAELNGLGTYRAFSPQISSALHSAVLSIDEYGASAAAATSFAAVALSYEDPSAVFKADRPFIVVLWDTATSLPLFMAKIEDPQP